MKVQGNALGLSKTNFKALKGQDIYFALSGLTNYLFGSQGAALGYLISPRWGARRISSFCRHKQENQAIERIKVQTKKQVD
ncbi:hypothetical protein CCP3SC15_170011 [Gammaproteobacteria bacterium]